MNREDTKEEMQIESESQCAEGQASTSNSAVDAALHVLQWPVVSITDAVANLLEGKCRAASSAYGEGGPRAPKLTTSFHACMVPSMSITEYLYRFCQYARISDSIMIYAMCLLDRLEERGRLAMCPLNVHRVLLASLVVASKSMEDVHFSNKWMSRLGGVDLGELNELEVEFCYLLSFDLNVPQEEFLKWQQLVHMTQGALLSSYHCHLQQQQVQDAHSQLGEPALSKKVCVGINPAPA